MIQAPAEPGSTAAHLPVERALEGAVSASSKERNMCELEAARQTRDMWKRLLDGARCDPEGSGSGPDLCIGNMRTVMIATFESILARAQSRVDEVAGR